MPNQANLKVGQNFRLRLSKPTTEQIRTVENDKTIRDTLTTASLPLIFAQGCSISSNKNFVQTNNKETGIFETNLITSIGLSIDVSSLVQDLSVEDTTRFTTDELLALTLTTDFYFAVFGPTTLDAAGVPQFVSGVKYYKTLVLFETDTIDTPSHDLATASFTLRSSGKIHYEANA